MLEKLNKGQEMKDKDLSSLSRRERQIMDIIYQNGEATASEVQKLLQDPPSYSSVRALLAVLEKKGHISHKEQGPRYVYYPLIEPDKVKKSALKHLMKTFFDNSTENVIAALMDISSQEMTEEELNKLTGLIENAKKEGK